MEHITKDKQEFTFASYFKVIDEKLSAYDEKITMNEKSLHADSDK